jgi:3-hydroxyisobutyrate dehydrogenase-like beta-hydroxyacid dehydrogenase
MDIAVLGMGRMGQGLASRLLDTGHRVRIWNRTPGKAPDVVGAGATEAATIAEAVDGAELVLSILANDAAVREVALGDGGVLASIGDGVPYVDASTVSADIAAELEERFDAFAAMPVLGAPSAVASGKAAYVLGGSGHAVEVVDRVLPDLTEVVKRFPEARLASAVKLAWNLMLLNAAVALAESFAVGRAGGLDDDQLRELLAGSPMLPPALGNRFEGILTGEQPSWWTNDLGAKDAGLAVDLAASAGIDLPLTATARDRFQAAADRLPADADIAKVGVLYRD